MAPRARFGRQTGLVAIFEGAIGDEDDFLEHRRVDFEIGLLADRVGCTRAANPVEPDRHLLVRGQLAFFGHTTPIFSALAGAVLPLGSVTAGVLLNLGKTITLPGSWESLNLGLRVCATAGIAMASAGIISSTDRVVALIEFMSPSLTRAFGSYD